MVRFRLQNGSGQNGFSYVKKVIPGSLSLGTPKLSAYALTKEIEVKGYQGGRQLAISATTAYETMQNYAWC